MDRSELFFNDLSATIEHYPTQAYVRQILTTFVETLAELVKSANVAAILRSSVYFDELSYSTSDAEVYGFALWRGDHTVDHDTRVFFNIITTKVPIEEEIDLEEEALANLLNYNYCMDSPIGDRSWAGAIALLAGGVAVSLQFSTRWNTTRLVLYRENRLAPPLVADAYYVPHASQPTHVEEIAAELRARTQGDIESVNDFLAKRGDVFPCLRFSPAVENQIRQLDRETLKRAVTKLKVMDETVRQWKASGKPQPDYLFGFNPESKSTMARQELARAREFPMPEGGLAVFEWHTHISMRHRIHFLVDFPHQSIIVGYIGNHLPTVLYP